MGETGKKVKALILAAAVLLICFAMSGSLAYFTQEKVAFNIISTGEIDIDLIEKSLVDGKETNFRDIRNVMPGDVCSKIVKLRNSGSGDAYVRIAVEKGIELAAGRTGQTDISLIALDINSADWTDGGDGYYYYNAVLRPGETTVPLFTTVTLDRSMGNMYQNCTVTVDVTAQAVQAANNGDSALNAAGWPAEEEG